MFKDTTHCRACQLQLCKGREEPPHFGLQVSAEDGGTQLRPAQGAGDTAYTCQTCGCSLINSTNRTVAGWRKLAA